MEDRELEVQMQETAITEEREKFEKEHAEKRRQADRLFAAGQTAEQNKIGIEKDKILIEMNRLGFNADVSDRETYLATARFMHDRQIAEAELLKTYSDRLLHEDGAQRFLALLALSEFLGADIIRRLASGGEDIVRDKTLEQLAKVDDKKIAAVARKLLDQRKVGTSAPNAKQSPGAKAAG